MTGKELTPVKNALPELPRTDVENFILTAIQHKAEPETIERFLAMRSQLKAEQAKQAFNEAMALFQSECPIIGKSKTVLDKSGKPRYHYAPLDVIVSTIRAGLAAHGFRYSVTSEIADNGWIVATCNVFHAAGHSESSTFRVPIDKDSYMNEQQKVAAALTYAKRYAFCNAFGILTGDEDTDATTPGKEEIPPQHTAPTEPAAAPTTGQTISGFVEEITQKANKTGGGTTYSIKVDGKVYKTFTKSFAEVAKSAKEDGKEITIRFTVHEKFGNQVSLLSTGIAQ